MLLWPQTISDLAAGAARVRAARYGVIECAGGEFRRLWLRPWPALVSIDEVRIWGPLRRRFDSRDRCRLYYKQPLGHGDYLALQYAISGRGCTLATCLRALATLDAIARIKQADAIVCQAWNPRLSARVMARHGWSRHTSDRGGRNYIKRFYGEYPANAILTSQTA
jgi:hypothetical protein